MVELNGAMGRLYNGMEWLSKLVYIQFLWVLGSVVGLVIGGVFPATMAMFAVLRKMIQGDDDFSFFKTFWASFRAVFWKANALGVIVAFFSFVLYFYLTLMKSLDGALFVFLYIGLLSFTFIFIVANLFLGPVFSHYELPFLQYLKMSLFFGFSCPFHGISMVGGLVAIYYLMAFIPGLLPFLSVSLLAWFLMYMANLAFHKTQQEQEAKQMKETKDGVIQ